MTNNSFAIDVINLNKSFHGKPAVINASLQVKKGDIFGFLGPNGSGKTTTIRMLCGLLKPDSGSGQCLGFDVIKDSLDIKRQVGYMTQRFSLYEDLSVKENLEFIARLYDVKNRNDAVSASIANLGLTDRQHQLAGTLSGGWKQRLALSAALIHRPQLLLLDEPTAGVDPKARRDFWAEIHELSQQGVTTLVSTHYMDEAERCTRLAYISNGRIIAEGSADSMIKQAGLTTWQVTGPNLNELSQQLKHLPGLEQVALFGASLHISGTDPTLMATVLHPFQKPPYEWHLMSPSLEDVFIALVGSGGERTDVP